MMRAMMLAVLVGGAAMTTGAAVAQQPAATAVAPEKLGLARAIAAKLVPPGAYQRLMGGPFQQMMQGMTQQMTSLPLAPFLKAAGMPEAQLHQMGPTTIKQVMDIVDPAYQQRMQRMMPVLLEGMGKVLTQFEPELREGMAEAYANHFTLPQLTDIARFFDTPSGSAFATQNMQLASDPAILGRMRQLMPKILAAMPDIMKQAADATADLPKPKTPQTMTDADRANLARLLGIDPAKLKKAPTS